MRVSILSAHSGLFVALLTLFFVASCDPTGNGGSENGSNNSKDTPSYRPASTAAVEVVEAPETGINLGWGYNTFDAIPVPTICVEFSEGSEPAQSRYMTMHEVSDSYEVMQHMGMSAEASVKFIGVEASGKAAFAKDTNITGFSSTFVLNATVDNGVRYTTPPRAREGTTLSGIRLNKEALALARKRDLDEFKHLCGNSFVSAVYSGAKLTAVLTMAASSHTEQERISAEMSGSGWGAKFKASYEEDKKSGSTSESMDLSIFQTGGRGDEIPASRDDLMEKLKTLSALAYDAPKDFRIAVMPYEQLSNWPAKSITGDEHEFTQIASYWGSYNSLYDEIQQVLDKPTGYLTAKIKDDGCFAITKLDKETDAIARLEQAQDEVLVGLKELTAFAQKCSDLEQDCKFPEEEFRSQYVYRVLLPIPEPKPPEPAGITPVKAISRYHIGDSAKRRCNMAADDPGCLSNGEIHEWRKSIGMDFLHVDRNIDLIALAKQVKEPLTALKADGEDTLLWRECVIPDKPTERYLDFRLESRKRAKVQAGKNVMFKAPKYVLWVNPIYTDKVAEIINSSSDES